MHSFTPEQKEQFARRIAEKLGVSPRCARKARQGNVAAIYLIKEKNPNANIGRSISMDEMAKPTSTKPREGGKKTTK